MFKNSRKQNYDLIVSLGEDCACSSYLRRRNLQRYSYPFDWLTRATMDTRVELLCNDFAGFLDRANIRPLAKPTTGNVDAACDYFHDTKTDFYFYHDFPAGMDFDAAYPVVREKYNRRIARLYDQIDKSTRILFVWWSRDKQHSARDITEMYNKLAARFSGKDISLLVIEHADTYVETHLCDGHVCICRYDNTSWRHNPKYTETMGNERNNMRVFRRIKLARGMREHMDIIMYHILRTLCGCVPVAKLRRSWRADLKTHYLHAKL